MTFAVYVHFKNMTL